jgi:hypothetical protein
LKPVEELPEKRERELVDYDSILDSFLIRRDKFFEVRIDRKNASYPKRQFDKRIEERYLDDVIKAYIEGYSLYLRK